MRDAAFLKQLRREMPQWIVRGWVSDAGGEAILDDVAARPGLGRMAPVALAVLGVVVFATGVVLFIAANWGVIPRPVKLAILFGGMWAAYAGGGVALARHGSIAQRFGHAFLLLGLLLYCANIALIGQIYNIAGSLPEGALMATLGALALALLLPSEPVAVAGLGLAVLWTFAETAGTTGLSRLHWPFLVVWAGFLIPVLRHNWRVGLHCALLALLLWEIEQLKVWWWPDTGGFVFMAQCLLLAGVALFAAAPVAHRFDRLADRAPLFERYALLWTFLPFYVLTLRRVTGLCRGCPSGPFSDFERAEASGWIVATLVVAVLAVGAALWRWRQSGSGRGWGVGVAVALAALSLATVLLPFDRTTATAIYVAYNLLYFGALVWLVHDGYRRNEVFQINIGFAFIAIGILTLYFDTFWSLLGRAYLFMLGGLLLVAVGWLLERQRRRLTASMGEREAAA
jgi:uncharacterized membrane protein